MNDSFLVIAITRPDFFSGEADLINEILGKEKARLVHIRKPGSSKEEMIKLINEIDSENHPKLKLHDHFELLNKFDLGGIHLNSRNRIPLSQAKTISISIHSYDEIGETENYDYFFISPVFDSISKEGYKAAFDLKDLSERIKNKNAIALGGVTPDKFPFLSACGFKGAALLGHFFPS